jgi:Mg2+/citrate symporter
VPKNPFKKTRQTKAEKDIKIEFISKITTLLTAGFGLVAALAWNDAIQSLFKLIHIQSTEVSAKFIYAVVITLIIVLVVYYANRAQEFAIHEIELSKKRMAERARERAEENKKKSAKG